MKVIPCDPFQLGWEGYSIPAEGFVDNFHLTPTQAQARSDPSLAGFAPFTAGPLRHLPGEPLYWSVLLVNDRSTAQDVTLAAEADVGRAFAWYQWPWYTDGRGIRVTSRRYLVPELLLKHDRVATADDLAHAGPGLPDHADPGAPVQLTLAPGAFAKILIKALTDPAGKPLQGRLMAGSETLFAFQGVPLSTPYLALPDSPGWAGLYYGLMPGYPSLRYGIREPLFEADLVYLQELGIDTLVVSVPAFTGEQLSAMARAGIRRVIQATPDNPADLVTEREAAREAGITPLFYTADEPHRSREALVQHLALAREIHAGHGQTFTAVSEALAETPAMLESLDVPNLAVWSLERIPVSKGTLYWQCAFERPAVNRLLAGVFAEWAGAWGTVPFVYRDGFLQNRPESVYTSDASVLYGGRLRNHLLTYPSHTGPVRTIQAEALHQGLADRRVLAAWRPRFLPNSHPFSEARPPELHDLLWKQLSPVLDRLRAPHVLQDLYNGDVPDPSLAPGGASSAWLQRARETALDLLEHESAHVTRFHALEGPPSEVRVCYDPLLGLRADPPGLHVEDFPLTLIEGFGSVAEARSALFDGEEPAHWEIRGT